MGILRSLNQEGLTIALVTHDSEVAAHTGRTLRLHDGLVVSDKRNGG